MNKNLIIIISILVVVVFVILFLVVNKKNNAPIINSPKELELTYEMSAGIPFKRIYEIEDESIVKLVKSYVSKDENTGGKVGAPVYTSYVFQGLKEGTTTITFKVVSLEDENNIMSVDKNIVKVDIDGNISVLEEK